MGFAGFSGFVAGFAAGFVAADFLSSAVAGAVVFFTIELVRGNRSCWASSLSNSSLVKPKSLGCSIFCEGCLIAEIEGGVPAGFCTVLGVADFAVVVVGIAVAGFAPGVAGFVAAAVEGTGLAVGGVPIGRAGAVVLCVGEIGTSGGTGACFLVRRASLSSKSIKMFLRSKSRSALGTRRTCLFSAVLGKIGSTAASRLSAASGAGAGFVSVTEAVLSARGAELAEADEGYPFQRWATVFLFLSLWPMILIHLFCFQAMLSGLNVIKSFFWTAMSMNLVRLFLQEVIQ